MATIAQNTRRALTLAGCDFAFTSRPTADVVARAERFRIIIRDRFNARSHVDLSTVKHYGGLIRTLQARDDADAADIARHLVWFSEFVAA